MQSPLQVQIVEVEDQLRTAVLSSDLTALNEFLAPDLIFTNHLGQLLGKSDDLAAYSSGVLKIDGLEPSEQHVRVVGEVSVVSVRMQVSGTYEGTPSKGDFRFARASRRQQWSATGHVSPRRRLGHGDCVGET